MRRATSDDVMRVARSTIADLVLRVGAMNGERGRDDGEEVLHDHVPSASSAPLSSLVGLSAADRAAVTRRALGAARAQAPAAKVKRELGNSHNLSHDT